MPSSSTPCFRSPHETPPEREPAFGVEIGDPAPAASHQTPSGEPYIVAFFGDDWEPARAEHLARYRQILEQLPATLSASLAHPVSSSDDTPRTPLLVIRPQQTQLVHEFGVAGKQAIFVVGGDGRICWKFVAPFGVYPTPEAVRDALMATLPESAGVPERVPAGAGLNRRDFLAAALGAALLLIALPHEASAAPAQTTNQTSTATVPVTLLVNGETRTLNLETRVTLLDALREFLGLTGTRKGCDHGQCGACTIHLSGQRINSCLTLAVMHQNVPITTIEGLASGDSLHPLQQAFIKHDGFQCGYCTPGQIMSAAALLTEGRARSADDVREGMSGNICRCGAYPNIIDAIEEVRIGTTANEGVGNAAV